MKEHPDPGSKDPEEDYPKFGLLDQVCAWHRRRVGSSEGGEGPSGAFCSAKGQISALSCVVPAVGGSPSSWSALLRLGVFTLCVQLII